MSLLELHLIWMGSIVITTILLQFALNTVRQLRLIRNPRTGQENSAPSLAPRSRPAGYNNEVPPAGHPALRFPSGPQNFHTHEDFTRLRDLVSLHKGS